MQLQLGHSTITIRLSDPYTEKIMITIQDQTTGDYRHLFLERSELARLAELLQEFHDEYSI